MKKAFFLSIPHSGEQVPPQTPWLQNLPEEVLMCDVDRYVDKLYLPAVTQLALECVQTQWHRYAADLNRIPQDIDQGSVVGAKEPSGVHNRGFHWTVTTQGTILQTSPMALETHEDLVELIYKPFHSNIESIYKKWKSIGAQKVFHIDAHSMPSLGTSMHRDPGQKRADVVVSDCHGKSCGTFFRDLVIAAYCVSGFRVAYNWPYFGGRVSEQYGRPGQGQEAIQVELNRDLYMDEGSKKLKDSHKEIQGKILRALEYIHHHLPSGDSAG